MSIWVTHPVILIVMCTDRPWSMVPVTITIRGGELIIIPGPGPGVSISATRLITAGVLAGVIPAAGSTSVMATVIRTGVTAPVGGVRPFTILLTGAAGGARGTTVFMASTAVV